MARHDVRDQHAVLMAEHRQRIERSRNAIQASQRSLRDSDRTLRGVEPLIRSFRDHDDERSAAPWIGEPRMTAADRSHTDLAPQARLHRRRR
jgi:hypothetical protein